MFNLYKVISAGFSVLPSVFLSALWLTVNSPQLRAQTWQPSSGPFWSFHLLFCHTHVPMAAKLHHTEVNKRKGRPTDVFSFILDSGHSFCADVVIELLPLTHYLIINLWRIYFVYVETVRTTASWFELKVVATHPLRSVTQCESFPQAWGAGTRVCFTAAAIQCSLSNSAQLQLLPPVMMCGNVIIKPNVCKMQCSDMHLLALFRQADSFKVRRLTCWITAWLCVKKIHPNL